VCLFEIFRSAFRYAGDVGNRYTGGTRDLGRREPGNNCGKIGLIVLWCAVNRQMEVGSVSVNKQSWREEMCPAEDNTGIVLTVLREPSGQTGTSDIRVGAVERTEKGSANLVFVADFVVDTERVPGGYCVERNELNSIDT